MRKGKQQRKRWAFFFFNTKDSWYRAQGPTPHISHIIAFQLAHFIGAEQQLGPQVFQLHKFFLQPHLHFGQSGAYTVGISLSYRSLQSRFWVQRWSDTDFVHCSRFQLTFVGSETVKNLPVMQETQIWFLGWEDPVEKRMATYSNILAWIIPWTEEPGGLQSWGCRVWHSWATNTFTFPHFTFIFLLDNLILWPLSPSDYASPLKAD